MKRLAVLATTLFLISGCGSADGRDGGASERGSSGDGLTAFQLEHGIGPITSPVALTEPDPALAAEGDEIYQMSCAACHRKEERFVGPPLGQVLDRRTPTFVLNMILNPDQMAREHPEGRAMLAEYPVVMPFQNISEDQAVAILHYLKTIQTGGGS